MFEIGFIVFIEAFIVSNIFFIILKILILELI